MPHTDVEELTDGFRFRFAVPRDSHIVGRTDWRPGLSIREGEATPFPVATLPGWLLGLVSSKPPRSDVLDLSRDGDVVALANDVIRRFPVRRPGTRNAVMLKALCSLIGRELRSDVIVDVLSRWWETFYVAGTIKTSPTEAAYWIEANLNSRLKCGTLRPANRLDHVALCRQIALLDLPAEMWKTHRERAFVLAVATHAEHRRANCGDTFDDFSMSHRFLSEIILDRFGLSLADKTVARYSTQFFAKPGVAATGKELASRVVRGRQGVASRYRLTGLRDFLEKPDSP